MINTYRILIRYRQPDNINSGRWLSYIDYQTAYTVEQAIEWCKQDNSEEFNHMNARIDTIWRETETDWTEIDWG